MHNRWRSTPDTTPLSLGGHGTPSLGWKYSAEDAEQIISVGDLIFFCSKHIRLAKRTDWNSYTKWTRFIQHARGRCCSSCCHVGLPSVAAFCRCLLRRC
jgi:hypothetical protein